MKMVKSEEANLNQIELAKSQGKAYVKALQHMVELVADHGEEKKSGDYIVAYALEKPEGMYFYENGELVWKEPGPSQNIHVEISIRDAFDNRFVYDGKVYATLTTAAGKKVGRHEQKLLWHPWLPHYGRNWSLPTEGTYNLLVEVEPPMMPRHDKKNGKRFGKQVEVEFKNVPIKLHPAK